MDNIVSFFKKKEFLIGMIILMILLIGGILFSVMKDDDSVLIDDIVVSFDTSGGTNIASITLDKPSVILQPDDPFRNGFIFEGWLYNSEEFNFSTTINESIKIVAKWRKLTDDDAFYTVTFDTDGGSGIDPVYVVANGKIVIPASPSRSSYKFDGWLLNDNLFDEDMLITSDITLVADWVYVDSITGETGTNTGELYVALPGKSYMNCESKADYYTTSVDFIMSGSIITHIVTTTVYVFEDGFDTNDIDSMYNTYKELENSDIENVSFKVIKVGNVLKTVQTVTNGDEGFLGDLESFKNSNLTDGMTCK